MFKELWKLSPTFFIMWFASAAAGLALAGAVFWAIVVLINRLG